MLLHTFVGTHSPDNVRSAYTVMTFRRQLQTYAQQACPPRRPWTLLGFDIAKCFNSDAQLSLVIVAVDARTVCFVLYLAETIASNT